MREDAQRLVADYSDLVKRLAFTYLRSTDDAQDICQDVLLKCLLREEPFADREHEKAWIIRVTANACKNVLASARYRRVVQLDEAAAVAAPQPPEADADVLDAVQNLPLVQREAIFLHYYEGYKIREIAQMTGRSEDSIAAALSRGRASLRTMLDDSSRRQRERDDADFVASSMVIAI